MNDFVSFQSYLIFQNTGIESGSFRSDSGSVRSFRPDFLGESFRPSWGGSFWAYFTGGVGRFGLLYLFFANRSVKVAEFTLILL